MKIRGKNDKVDLLKLKFFDLQLEPLTTNSRFEDKPKSTCHSIQSKTNLSDYINFDELTPIGLLDLFRCLLLNF